MIALKKNTPSFEPVEFNPRPFLFIRNPYFYFQTLHINYRFGFRCGVNRPTLVLVINCHWKYFHNSTGTFNKALLMCQNRTGKVVSTGHVELIGQIS
jgi:hypothetical protein